MDYKHVKILVLLCFSVLEVTSYTTTDANNLYTALTYGYNKIVRPAGTTPVTVDFSLLSLNYLDVKEQKMSVTGWFDAEWSDARFSWTPASYGNIGEMFFDYSTCWNPKLIVDNLADDAGILDDSALMFRIVDSGSVTWSPSGDFTVHCAMDVTNYPFDKQTCFLSVKSWSYDTNVVNLTFASTSINTAQYVENDVWELDAKTMTSEDVTQNSFTYSNLKFKMTFTRRSSTWVMTNLLPLVLVSFLSLFVFAVPVESDAKLGFPVAVLVLETILMTIILGDLPLSGRKTPVLGTYLLVILVLSMLEILLTIVVLKTYHNKAKDKRVSDAAIRMAVVLNVITCYNPRDRPLGQQSNSSDSPIDDLPTPQTIDIPPDFKTSIRRNPSIKSVSPDCSFATSRQEEFHHEHKRVSAAWIDSGGMCGGGTNRKYLWEDVSRALDRFCFFLFLFFRSLFCVVFLVILFTG